MAADFRQLFKELVLAEAMLLQQAACTGGGALVDHGHEQMFDGHIIVLEPAGLAFRALQQAGQPLGDGDLTGGHARAADPRAAGKLRLQLGPQPISIDIRLREQPGAQAVGLIEQGQQQMLPVHLGVPEAERLGLRVVQPFLRLLRQFVRVHGWPPLPEELLRAAISSIAIRSSRSATRPMAA